MLSTMIRKHSRNTIAAGCLAVLLILVFVGYGFAAYRIQRPITYNGGVILQTYLWGEGSGHRGIDFVCPLDTAVYAVASGTVTDLEETRPDGDRVSQWGNFVLVQHDQRHYDRTTAQWAYVYSMYIHLSQNSVQVAEGNHVNAGDWIAEVDHSGMYAGDTDHLHLQIVVHPQSDRKLDPFTLDSENRSRNPELWLAPYNGNTGTVVGKVTNTNGNPVGGLLVYGLQKQAGWGYGSSQTYITTTLKPDDILVEN
jgi:murein DD-endopeptidase MepM/ murein hydrolase activator NlpD